MNKLGLIMLVACIMLSTFPFAFFMLDLGFAGSLLLTVFAGLTIIMPAIRTLRNKGQ